MVTNGRSGACPLAWDKLVNIKAVGMRFMSHILFEYVSSLRVKVNRFVLKIICLKKFGLKNIRLKKFVLKNICLKNLS